MNFYKHYLGDYDGDTAHLSWDEDMAYTRLLRAYYRREKPIQKSEAYRLCRAQTKVQRAAVDTVLAEFFIVEEDGHHNKRADEEISTYERQASTNRRIARERTVRKSNNEPSTKRERSVERIVNEPNNEPSTKRIPNQIPDTRETLEPWVADATPSEPAVADCPQQRLIELYAKHLPTLTQPRVWDGQRAQDMRARWRQCAKASATFPGYRTVEDGLRFWEQFFAGVAESKKLTEGIPYSDGTVWKPDLPWLMKAANFAKVIEGKFHS